MEQENPYYDWKNHDFDKEPLTHDQLISRKNKYEALRYYHAWLNNKRKEDKIKVMIR